MRSHSFCLIKIWEKLLNENLAHGSDNLIAVWTSFVEKKLERLIVDYRTEFAPQTKAS